MLELVQSSIAVAAAYVGWQAIRRPPAGTPLFGLLLFGVAALAGLGLLAKEVDSQALGAVGAIGIGAGTCMLVLGPLARTAARRLALAERYRLAARLLDVADILAPGSGVADEKALLGAMREIREGRIEQTIAALTHAKHGAPTDARIAIDERIAMLYLAAYRWTEGIAHAEEFLLGQPRAELTDTSTAPQIAIRRALGVAPPVWIELLGAYGRTGNLERAAGMLARLEDACALRDDAASAIWLHRARLMFLALAGRVAAVEQLTVARASRHLSSSARAYWRGVAHERRGERAAATAAYERARRGARGMPRDLIDQALARLGDGALSPVVLGDEATAVIARVEAEPVPAITRVGRRPPVATWTLTAACLAVAAAVLLAFGPTSDLGVLFRAGSMIRGQVRAGEWWRLVACVMLHAGAIHLVVNAVSLFFLGRFTEDLYGTARTFAIFALAGLGGSVASFAMNPGPSAGASGAIFGLLGAALVELLLHRRRYAALRPIWSTLALLAAAQLAYGFFYKEIDQWAHGGGLVAGALAGALLSPTVPWQRAGLWLARVVAVGAGALAIAAAVFVIRTPAQASLDASPKVPFVINGVTVDAPASWTINDGELYDGAVFVVLAFDRSPAPPAGSGSAATDVVAPVLAKQLASEPERVTSRNFDDVDTATDSVFTLPPGWAGSELEATVEDDLGDATQYRVLVAGKQFDNTIVVASLYAPASLARAAPEFFTALLASAR
jgi:membrane associated rhomboid family serine protease|nr:rhomboid family intramembrane serine protease [Kofleriaceae bacterium]